MLVLQIHTLFLPIFSILAPSHGTLSKVLPMVWSDTKTTLKTGESNLLLEIKFLTPCEQFYDAAIVPDTKEGFVTWCDKEVVDNVIRPLEVMCRPPSVGRRKKRGFTAFLGAIPLLGNAITSLFGGSSKPARDPAVDQLISKVGEMSADIQNTKNRVAVNEREIEILKRKVENGEAEMRVLKERTAELERMQAEMEAAIRILAGAVEKLDSRLRVVEIDVDQIKEWRKELTESLGPTMTLVSKLSAYFAVARSDLNEVERDWKEKRLNLRLLDVFMAGGNSSLVEVYRGAIPIECHIDARAGLASFLFKKDNTDFGVHVLRANPFTLYEMKNGSDLGYKLEYIGPSQVAFDAASDCIVPYSDGPADVLLFPGEKDCLIMDDRSVYKYWRKTCELMYYMDDNVIQVKALGDLYYIYCYGFQIRMYKTTHICPNFVFPVNNKEVVEILNGKAVAKLLRPTTFEVTQDFHSSKAVYHLMPKIMELEFNGFPLSSTCPTISKETGKIVEIEGEDSKGIGATPVMAGFAILTIVIIAIGVALFFYVKGRTAAPRGQNGQQSAPLMNPNTARNENQYEMVK